MLQRWTIKKAEPTELDIEIARLHDTLKGMEPYELNYANTADQLVKLKKLQSEVTSKARVSPDKLTDAATNLAGILLILNFEHAHVMTSKALNFVKNLR